MTPEQRKQKNKDIQAITEALDPINHCDENEFIYLMMSVQKANPHLDIDECVERAVAIWPGLRKSRYGGYQAEGQ